MLCEPAQYEAVSKALQAAGFRIEASQIARIPQNTVDLDEETGRQVLKLLEKLDDHDDVQAVVTSYNMPAEAVQ